MIKSQKKAFPKAMVPSELLHRKDSVSYPMALRGYYVANTEYFNVMPNDCGSIDMKRIEPTPIGYIFEENPFICLGKDYMQRLSMRDIKIDTSKSAAERLLGNHIAKHEQISLEEKDKLKEYLAQKYAALPTDELFCGDLAAKMLGYYDEDELHLIQLSTLVEVKLESYSLKLDVFSRNTGILESDIMLNKRAMFIGCGSVGSLVAVELAKAGVGNFMLVDMDVFGYHNICRHQCGIYDVGKYKTDAVAERILQINPYARITKHNTPIQDVDVEVIKNFCTEDTIIIGGADNRDGDNYICRYAMEGGSAFLSIGCWERAFAGEVFYCLPGMPDYSDFLSAIGYVSGRVTQNRRFYTTQEELEKVSFEPGISADINFVTIVAVKMALDLLNRNNKNYTQRVIPHLSQYTLICNTNETAIGGEQAEIFSYPLQVSTSITVPFKENLNE